MTSNVGASEIARGGSLGFGGSGSGSAGAEDKLLEIAKRAFRPEFINRVDDVVVFRRLEKADLIGIVELELNKLGSRLKDLGYAFSVSDEVKEYLIGKGYEPEFGARPLRRAVERFLEDPLAEELLKERFRGASGIRVEMDQQKLLFLPERNAAKKTASGRSSKKKA